jgi:hypothetical protein
VVALGIVFLVGNATGGIGVATRDASDGVGFNSAALRSSQLALTAGSLPGQMVSNDPVLVYWVSGLHPISSHAALLQAGNAASTLRDRVASGAVTYYAYFFIARTAQGVSKEELAQAGVVLNEAARYQDGILYTLTVGPEP